MGNRDCDYQGQELAGSTNSVAFLETCLLNFELQFNACFKARYLSSATA